MTTTHKSSVGCCSASKAHSHHDHEHGHHHHHHHGHEASGLKRYLPCISSFIMLLLGVCAEHLLVLPFFNQYVKLGWYILAYLPVGLPVLREALKEAKRGDFFNEFSLMGIASIGAFCIGEYPEGVAVMLFYSFGELLQDSAVDKARNNIKALLDIRPQVANVFRNGTYLEVSPQEVEIGERIQVKAGEKVPLDGILLSEQSSFNTSALTGESVPRSIKRDEPVLAGMLNIDKVIEMKSSKAFEDSSLARILTMVEEATSRKAKTELLIRRLAKVYTPIVFALALLVTVIPLFVVDNYVFSEWLYRGLVFLVISCPCALVVSIPLSYFGGIGAASRHGILFKGANYLDVITKVNTVIMDKTGTLTKGVFTVQHIEAIGYSEDVLLRITSAIEKNSNHPIAKAITDYQAGQGGTTEEATDVTEIAGHGLIGKVGSKTVCVGNTKLMQKEHIAYDSNIDRIIETVVLVAIDGVYAGYITIADQLKDDSKTAIDGLKKMHIRTMILSGDHEAITQKTAQTLGIDVAHGNLLPEDKAAYVEDEKEKENNCVAFVGDGINDSVVLAMSDVGIAMGGMGADAAIEVADVVIQTDQPSKIATAIRIGKYTQYIVTQNIIFVFMVKGIIMGFGALGYASMWAAVFADVGVALLAILNAIRILKHDYEI